MENQIFQIFATKIILYLRFIHVSGMIYHLRCARNFYFNLNFFHFRISEITGGPVILMPKYHLEAYKVSSNFHLPFLLFFLSDSVFIYVLEPECVRIVGRYKPVIKFKKMIINVYLLQQIHPVFALTCFILLIVKIMISNRRSYIFMCL